MVLGMASMALVVVEAARLLSSSVDAMAWEESLRRFGMLSVAHEYHPGTIVEWMNEKIAAITDSRGRSGAAADG